MLKIHIERSSSMADLIIVLCYNLIFAENLAIPVSMHVIVHGHIFSCFYAKAAKMRVAAGDLRDGRVTR